MTDATPNSRLALFLSSKAITQNQLAEMLKTSQPTISAILGGNRNLSKGMIARLGAVFPDLDKDWLLTGEGTMPQESSAEQEVSILTAPTPSVPLYSLESVAGFSGQGVQPQYIEKEIPWANAKDGDFAVHVTGNSMEPRIPNGSMVLVRPYNYTDYTELEFGRVHVVVTDDDRAMIKVVKLDPDNPRHILLISFNPDYPARSIPVSSIRRVFLAVFVQAPL